MANVGAGVFQGMPVSTSLSASSLNESAGARTPVASLVTGGLVVATLIVLAPLFSELPKAVLGAIIIDAVVFGMIDIPELRRLHRVARFDFWIAVAAIVGVLSAGVLAGVVIGVVLSLGWLVYVATRPADAAARPRAGHAGVPRRRRVPGATRPSEGSRCCGSTAASSSPPPRRSRTACAGSPTPEPLRGARARPRRRQLRRLAGLGEARRDPRVPRGARASSFRLARLKPQVRSVLETDGVIDVVGADHVHGNVHRAVEAELAG